MSFSRNKPIGFKHKLENLKGYSFIHILTQSDLTENEMIFQNIKKSNFLMINQYIEQEEKGKGNMYTYIVIGFKKTIIKIEKSIFSILQPLLSFNPNINICFLSKIDGIKINNNLQIIDNDDNFITEIESFNDEIFLSNTSDAQIHKIWKFIRPCISGYLIKESYEKTKINRLDNFINFEQRKEKSGTKTTLGTSSENFSSNEILIIKEDEFIELRDIGLGSNFKTVLIYHIERGELYALKKQQGMNKKIGKLIKREIENYSKIQHPLTPKFIGAGQNNEYHIIEYINGRTLLSTNKFELNFNEKITIFFELMIIIEFLHRKGFIYRDLKPNNIMIDENKTAVLIDFDRIIEKRNSFFTTTKYFSSPYHAPEVNKNSFSYECDIYSLGCIFLYIMNPNKSFEQSLKEFSKSNEFNEINEIIGKSINEKENERPSILEMIFNFYISYSKYIQISNLFEIYLKNFTEYYKFDITNEKKTNQNLLIAQFYIGVLYFVSELIPCDMNKSIHYLSLAADQNYVSAQYTLGFLYENGELIPRDMNKSIHYFSLAANQNDVKAQYNLGVLYSNGELIPQDMNKSIHYLSLAANKNDVRAQYYLGKLYEEGKLILRDMNKSIHYYSLAANKNDVKAQYNLGVLYSKGELIPRDMNKSIHYLSLAANKNDVRAQYNLGILYEEGKLIPRDINKSIYYYSLAADHDNEYAQFKLGVLYSKGELIPRNMNKSIHYYSLAAKQNNAYAQLNLGILYSKGELIPRNMKKSIYYLSLAANQNDVRAQYNLGKLYEDGILIPRDINKSIYYYSLAADHDNEYAQFKLGVLYSNGELIPRDVNKSIYYLSLAVNQNNAYAQFYLGMLYSKGGLIPQDINKSIYYLSLAANQNNAKAQFYLGMLYSNGELIPRDINKSIYYYSFAANQNNAKAQYNLGVLYSKGELIPRDMNKSIFYLSLAANQNYTDAQYNLGYLYSEGKLIPRDMNKSIHYYSLAANKNDSKTQCNLGFLYSKGELIPRDMNKSIYYYSLAANQNDANAQFNLGVLYSKGELIPRDMNKSIHYYSLAANQNHAKAQFNLGILYEDGKLIPRDRNKSIHYFSLAANKSDANAQFNLAIIYLSQQNVKKAIDYFTLAAYQNNKESLFFLALFNLKGLYVKKNPYNGIDYLNQCLSIESKFYVYSNFMVGYFHHVGLYVKRDINKAIKCYKESSSFNYSLAKNNCGIIYKHGDDGIIKKELEWAIEYFEESIKYGNHPISMYNLAHLYFYENPIENSRLESIKLLIKASNKNHYPSKFLLCIVLIYEYGNDIKEIIQNLNKIESISNELTDSLYYIIEYNQLDETSILKEKYEQYRNIDYIFDFDFFFSEFSKDIDFLENGIQIKDENQKEKHRKNIDSDFYEGFNI